MGYRIFTGHRLESLVEAHLSRFLSPFFGPRPGIVIQSQSLAQWLKLFLARRAGGYATGDLLFQDEALRRLLAGAAPGGRVLFLDDLKFALYRHLARSLAGPADPVFEPLTGRHGSPDPLRLFELADHIAGVFHNYAMNSGLWPAALASGTMPPGSHADPAAFAWQSRLWKDLLTGDQGTLAGVVMEGLTKNPPRPAGPPQRLLIVGSAFLSRRAAAFLRAWADAGLVEVDHLLLLPAPAASVVPGPGRRPWSSWGVFGRAFLQLLPLPEPEAPGPQAGTFALARLQAALAEGTPFPATVPDASLEVASSPHPLRELEALRDRLLTALAADPSLEVHEIAVLAPDINVYAPFFDAVFGSDDPGRNLRYHVIDLDLGRENAWFRALDALLALISGTIDRPTLFTLVDTPAFQESWDLDPDDRELWLEYTEEVSAWREEEAGPAPQSWSRSWDRLFTGWFRPDPQPASAPPPLDAAPSAFRSLGRFHKLVEDLRSRHRETRHPRTFLDWIRFLDQTEAAFLSPGEGTGAILSGRLRTLALDAGSPADPLPWTGFRAFVQDQIAHFPGRRGQLLTEGIHCSSLKPLRAIPFRVIAVLGLDEGRFPRQSPVPSFDLRRFEDGQEEVSSLALDRYSFWETLMAARDVLYLSYQGRSPVDGSEKPPSPVLADLLDYLEESGSPWPVSQITVKDFSAAEAAPPTWSPRTRRRAEALARRRPGRPLPAASFSLPEPPPLEESFPEVRTSEIVQAFTAPARFHLRRVRQVVLQDEDRRGVDEEEPWSMPFLDRQAWLQERLRRRLAGTGGQEPVEDFLRIQTATGRVREGVFADRDRRELEAQAGRVEGWAQELLSEGWGPEGGTQNRTRWAGRPWAAEPRDRLVRGAEVLVPRLLYSENLPARSKVDAALRFLLDPAPAARLATLSPRGEKGLLTWNPPAAETKVLAERAEAYWQTAAAKPLPFYPDYLEALADRRTKEPAEPWSRAAEEAWRKVRSYERLKSEGLLANCPYAALAFGDEPDWDAVADDLGPWWTSLFVPLLEAWS